MTTAIRSVPPLAEPHASVPVVSDASGTKGHFSAGEREALRRAFAEHGYVVLRGVVSADKVADLNGQVLAEFDRLSRSGRLATMGGIVTGHLNCFPGLGAKFVVDTLEERGVIDLMRSFFSKSISTPNIGLNLNLPNSVVQHYHVDSQFTEDFMIANVATVDTDLTNGAIEVVPGSHKAFHPYWRFVVERTAKDGVRLPLRRGDVLIRTSNLWHRGMPNRSATPRPMVALTYVVKSAEEQARDPFALNGGELMFYENWYRSNRLGRIRERTYVAAPITYAAYRFVRSFFGKKGYGTL